MLLIISGETDSGFPNNKKGRYYIIYLSIIIKYNLPSQPPIPKWNEVGDLTDKIKMVVIGGGRGDMKIFRTRTKNVTRKS